MSLAHFIYSLIIMGSEYFRALSLDIVDGFVLVLHNLAWLPMSATLGLVGDESTLSRISHSMAFSNTRDNDEHVSPILEAYCNFLVWALLCGVGCRTFAYIWPKSLTVKILFKLN